MRKRTALIFLTFAIGLLVGATAFAQDKLPARLAGRPGRQGARAGRHQCGAERGQGRLVRRVHQPAVL